MFWRKNGSRIDYELLRPLEWVERHRLEVGSDIFMSNAEIEVRGTGRVLAIEDCPPIADGDGAVVISRIKTHWAGDLFEITFENGETLTGTGNHPVWSVDRQDWVGLGALQEGEYVQARDGILAITHVQALPDLQAVYNLEVHGEHVYEVTESGVLVHNNNSCWDELLELRAKKAAGTLGDDAARLADLEKRVADGTLGPAGTFWGKPVEANGRRVYRRNDLFDPKAVDKNGVTNLDRMKRGQPPIGHDGKPVNLHHTIQQEPGAIAEVGGEFHSDHTKTLHGLVEDKHSFRYSPDGKTTEAEKAFRRWSYKYWQDRAKGF